MALKSDILYVSCLDNTVNSIDLKNENVTLRAPTTTFNTLGYGIAINSNSIVYVADYDNNMIRYIKVNDQVIDIILTKNPVSIVVDSMDAIYYIYRYQFIVKYYDNRITYLGNSYVYNCLSEIIIDSHDNIFLLDPCGTDGNYIWKIPYSDQSQREEISIHSCIIGENINAFTVDSDDNILVTLKDGEFSYLYLINLNQSTNMTQLCLPNERMNISGMVVDKSNNYIYISDIRENEIYEVTDYCRTSGPNECSVYPANESISPANGKSDENLYALFALIVLFPIAIYSYWYSRKQKSGKTKKPALLTDNRQI